MLKICLCSDNHGNMESIRRILSENPACDYYLHCGDSMVSPDILSPFASVLGNNDWDYDYPRSRKFEIHGHRIFMFHGTGYTYSQKLMLNKAKDEKADVVFFGHTHVFTDETINKIRFINPGSTYHNRDMSCPCYAIVCFYDDGSISVERKDLI